MVQNLSQEVQATLINNSTNRDIEQPVIHTEIRSERRKIEVKVIDKEKPKLNSCSFRLKMDGHSWKIACPE